MKSMMPPRNVFLDTSVFIEANFNYASPRFRSIASLAAGGLIQVLLTDLTIREIKANLKETVKRALPVEMNPILKNSTLPEVTKLLERIDQDAVEKELLDQFDNFGEAASVRILKIDAEALQEVLNDYFERQPPFGPGKNKAEFPDAFALNALRKWCESESDKVAVVTRDKGIAAACEDNGCFHYFEDLAKYLDSIASDDETRSDFVRQNVLRHQTTIFEMAKKKFSWLGFYLSDVDGDVEDVELTQFDFYDEGVEIIFLSDESATLEVSVNALFTASVSYDEPGTGTYDHEDGRLYFPNVISEHVERNTDLSVALLITFKGVDPDSIHIDDVQFSGRDTIEVESDYNADWPYK